MKKQKTIRSKISDPFNKRQMTPKLFIKVMLYGVMIYATVGGLIIGALKLLQIKLPALIGNYFNLSQLGSISDILKKQTDFLQSNISLSAPGTLASYLSALSGSTIARTKLSVMETFANGLSGILSALISCIIFITVVILIIKYISYCKSKLNQTTSTQAVVNELLPELQEINKNLKRLLEKNDLT